MEFKAREIGAGVDEVRQQGAGGVAIVRVDPYVSAGSGTGRRGVMWPQADGGQRVAGAVPAGGETLGLYIGV